MRRLLLAAGAGLMGVGLVAALLLPRDAIPQGTEPEGMAELIAHLHTAQTVQAWMGE